MHISVAGMVFVQHAMMVWLEMRVSQLVFFASLVRFAATPLAQLPGHVFLLLAFVLTTSEVGVVFAQPVAQE